MALPPKVTALVYPDAVRLAHPYIQALETQTGAGPASSLPGSQEVTLFWPPQLLVCKDHGGDL